MVDWDAARIATLYVFGIWARVLIPLAVVLFIMWLMFLAFGFPGVGFSAAALALLAGAYPAWSSTYDKHRKARSQGGQID